MSDKVPTQTTEGWSISMTNNEAAYPWVLFYIGHPVASYASYGSAYSAMMKKVSTT
jgi:hypothetical protein